MGFFEDVATNVKNAADMIGEKAGNVYDISKLTYTANGLKNDIKKKLADFGKKVYDSVKDGSADISAFKEDIDELDALYLQLDSANELIAQAKNQRICPKCSKAVSKDAEFCEYCGEKL